MDIYVRGLLGFFVVSRPVLSVFVVRFFRFFTACLIWIYTYDDSSFFIIKKKRGGGRGELNNWDPIAKVSTYVCTEKVGIFISPFELRETNGVGLGYVDMK